MIKNYLIVIAVMLLFITPVYSHEQCKDEPKQYSLILNRNLPHLMPVILNNMEKLSITEEQDKALKEILADVIEPFFTKAGRAMTLEKQIAEDILKNDLPTEVINSKIDQLTLLKREVLDIHISVISRIKKILSEQQYKKLLTLAEEKHKH
jgi:hypothetical protein